MGLSARSGGRNDFALIGLVVASEELADRAALSFALRLADTSTGGGRITSESLVVTFVTDLASISGEDASAGEVVALLVDTRAVEAFSINSGTPATLTIRVANASLASRVDVAVISGVSNNSKKREKKSNKKNSLHSLFYLY